MITADGTSFQTGGAFSLLVQLKYLPDDHAMRDGPLRVAAQKGVSLVCYSIQYCMVINAAGDTGNPIYIVAVVMELCFYRFL